MPGEAYVPTDWSPGLEHEEILYRFTPFFVACCADSATENAKLLLPNDDRVTFVETTATRDLELLPQARLPRVTLA